MDPIFIGFLLLALLIFLIQHPWWCLTVVVVLLLMQIYWDRVCDWYQVYQRAKVTANEAFVTLKTTETVEEFIADWDSRSVAPTVPTDMHTPMPTVIEPHKIYESTITTDIDLHKVSETEFTGVLVHQVDQEGNLIDDGNFDDANLDENAIVNPSMSSSTTSESRPFGKIRNVNGSQRPIEMKVTDSHAGKIQKLIDFAELYGNLDKDESAELNKAKKVIIPVEEIFQFLSSLNQLSDKSDKVLTNQVDNIKRQFESIVNTYSQESPTAMNQVL